MAVTDGPVQVGTVAAGDKGGGGGGGPCAECRLKVSIQTQIFLPSYSFVWSFSKLFI